MDDLEDMAISVVNNYLISLLKDKKFCQARRVGDALKILVESIPSEPLQNQTCMPDERHK